MSTSGNTNQKMSPAPQRAHQCFARFGAKCICTFILTVIKSVIMIVIIIVIEGDYSDSDSEISLVIVVCDNYSEVL